MTNNTPPDFHCTCENVAMGSYDNQVTVEIPPHMSPYKEARLEAGLSCVVCIDRCILETVQHLWSLGIRTIGSCCGHGDPRLAYVAVLDADITAMRSLGLRTIPGENAYVFHIRERVPENVWKRLARKLYRELTTCPSCDGGGYIETRIRDSQGYDIDCDIDECKHCMGYGDSHTAAVKRQSNKLREKCSTLEAENARLKAQLNTSSRLHTVFDNTGLRRALHVTLKRAEAWKLAAELMDLCFEINEVHNDCITLNTVHPDEWGRMYEALEAARELEQEKA